MELLINTLGIYHTHNPCMVTVLETRRDSHAIIKDEFYFSNFMKVPTIGRSIRIVLLWQDNIIDVSRVFYFLKS